MSFSATTLKPAKSSRKPTGSSDSRCQRLCFNGPEEDLKITENTQPAILTVSVAACRVLQAKGLRPSVVAGHSLGEYSALVAAGALTFSDAVALVRRRGRYMQEAVPAGAGAMAALLGIELPAVQSVCETGSAGTSRGAGESEFSDAGRHCRASGSCRARRDARKRERRKTRHHAAGERAVSLHAAEACGRTTRTGTRCMCVRRSPVPVVTNVDAQPATTAAAARDALEETGLSSGSLAGECSMDGR